MALSFGDIVLQPIPCLVGYSQLQQRIKSNFETLKQTQLNVLEVNPVQAVLDNEFREHMSEIFPVRAGGEELRKVPGARPTSEGDDGFHILEN